MNITAIDRIAAAINCLRPDWPVSSIRTLITARLSERAAVDVAVALTVVACDPTSKTPARVIEDGNWWKVAQAASRSSEADRARSNVPVQSICVDCGFPDGHPNHPSVRCETYSRSTDTAPNIYDLLDAARAEAARGAQARTETELATAAAKAADPKGTPA